MGILSSSTSRRSTRMALVIGLPLAVIVGRAETFAQEAFGIDYQRGRMIIDDPLRAIEPYWYAIDHDSGILYVNDLEEPNGIMAFSLATGEWLHTHSVSEGEGPGELKGISGVVLAPEGGLYVWRYPKALHIDHLGVVVSEWRPEVPQVWMDLCVFGGQPTVPVRGGLIRRGVGRSYERIGLTGSEPEPRGVETLGEVVGVIKGSMRARLACTRDLAFVLPAGTARADSIFVYSNERLEGKFPIPIELIKETDAGAAGRLDLLADDGWGNLVLIGVDPFADVPGAVMDPESGCHTLLRNPRPQLYRQFVGVYADSALVFHWDHEEEVRRGERIVHIRDRANRVSLHPFESLGEGEPCARILPSVR